MPLADRTILQKDQAELEHQGVLRDKRERRKHAELTSRRILGLARPMLCPPTGRSFTKDWKKCTKPYRPTGFSTIRQINQSMKILVPQLPVRRTIEIIHEELGRRMPRLTIPMKLAEIAARPFDLAIKISGKTSRSPAQECANSAIPRCLTGARPTSAWRWIQRRNNLSETRHVGIWK